VNTPLGPRLAFAVVLLLVAFAAPGVAAQDPAQVSGTVTDSRNARAIHGIVVEAIGTRSVAVTDEAGRYALTGLAPGSYVVRFRWFGYRDRDERVTVAPGQASRLDVALEPEPLPMGEIVVTTASRQPERVIESPAAVATVSPGRVRDLVATGQTPLLVADLPGVQVMQGGVNSFNVNTRA
jgi:hypothetical protein